MFFMMERLFSFLPAVDESPGGEESIDASAAENHQGHEVQDDDAGARRTPVGLPRPLETACWVPYKSDRWDPAPDAPNHGRREMRSRRQGDGRRGTRSTERRQTDEKREEEMIVLHSILAGEARQ